MIAVLLKFCVSDPEIQEERPTGLASRRQRQFVQLGRHLQHDVAVSVVGGYVRQRIAGKGPHLESAERLRTVY